jgi:two-component system, NtrC family, sensor histidine kinase KinB
MEDHNRASRTKSATAEARTSALWRISAAIETAATLDELLMLALNEIAVLAGVPLCGVFLFDDQTETGQLVSTYPPRTQFPAPIAIKSSEPLQFVRQQRQAYQITDIHALGGSSPLREAMYTEKIRTLLLIPMVAQDRSIGVLALATVETSRHFTPEEIALIRVMAGQLAAALVAFRITESAQRRSAELATLNDIAAVVTSSLDTREVYHLVVQKLNEYFQVDAGSLLMRDDETGDLEFVMTLEAGEEKLAGVRVPRGQGVVGYVAENQSYAIVRDPANDPRFYSAISESVGYKTSSILCVPMVVKGRSIGVIELLNKRDGEFTEDDGRRLTRMATTIGVAIENARLFQQVTTGRDRFEAILNSTNDGILMADPYGTVMIANPMALRLFELRRDQMIGRDLDGLLAILRTLATEAIEPPYLNDEHTPPVVELELNLAGERRYIRCLTLPVREAGGIQIGKLALLQDISKEREVAQLRDDYTGMLVHDMRAPLTAIMNGIMMVKRGLGGPVSEKQHELLSIAHQGSQTMLEMVNLLLDIAKMEQGRLVLDLEPLSPYGLVDATLERLKSSAHSQNVELLQQLPLGLPLINADREKIVRVLQNLLDNAIKFSPSGGSVRIGAAHGPGADWNIQAAPPTLPETLPEGEWLMFWVRDQGPGIPAQYHQRIFDKFGQVRGNKMRGTGLGLTFCKLVVEAHHGQIWLESIEGQGSTFAFALPLAPPPADD